MRYTRLDGCRAWLTYAQLRPDALSRLISELGDADVIYDRFTREGGGFLESYAAAEQIGFLREHATPQAMHDMMETMRRHQMGIISRDDFVYPDSLRDIPDPPQFLFYRGRLDCAMGKCITIVGSRKPSLMAVEATIKIARELSEHDVRIISGLAMGIDAAAHQGCLDGGSPTIGVMACGMDINYPAENKKLRESIVNAGGLLLSEYPPGVHAMSWHFPIRNRILAGLSRGVIMIEAKIRSGSMTTVQHALDQGKDVFAYPGNIGTMWAEGTHQLLREGANYFTSAMDVLEDMGWLDEKPAPTREQQQSLPPMTDEQRQVFTRLSEGEKSFDQLAAETGLDTPALSGALTMLQILGLIKALPGKSYIRA